MKGSEGGAEGGESGGGGFEEGDDFGIDFDLVFPAVDRFCGGDQIDAGGQLPGNEFGANLSRGGDIGEGREDEEGGHGDKI